MEHETNPATGKSPAAIRQAQWRGRNAGRLAALGHDREAHVCLLAMLRTKAGDVFGIDQTRMLGELASVTDYVTETLETYANTILHLQANEATVKALEGAVPKAARKSRAKTK